jgi:hypothetical protein
MAPPQETGGPESRAVLDAAARDGTTEGGTKRTAGMEAHLALPLPSPGHGRGGDEGNKP